MIIFSFFIDCPSSLFDDFYVDKTENSKLISYGVFSVFDLLFQKTCYLRSPDIKSIQYTVLDLPAHL